MTDFRLMQRLHAYSGGTVPDSDRIHYSSRISASLLCTASYPQFCINTKYMTLKCSIQMLIVYRIAHKKSIHG